MSTINKYDVLSRRSGYPCPDATTYGWYTETITSQLELPSQHRTKPANLLDNLTALGLQYSDVRISRIEHRMTPTTISCGGKVYPAWYEDWSRIMVTQDWPATPTPEWELAMRNKIQSDKVSFAENIGEWRESVEALKGGSDLLKRAWRKVKMIWRQRHARRKLRAAFRILMDRDPENRFELWDVMSMDLAIKFGLTPYVSQLQDCIDVLSSIKQCRRRLQVTVKAETEKSTSGLNGGTYHIRWIRSYRAIAYVTYDWESSDFTAGNIGEALWAGTKLSFMVDWFWNVSSYLRSFNATNGVTSLRGVLCDRQRVIGRDDRLDLVRGPGVSTSIVRVGTWARRSYQRTTFTSIPLASVPMPQLPDSEIWGKLLSSGEILASLIKQRLSSR